MFDTWNDSDTETSHLGRNDLEIRVNVRRLNAAQDRFYDFEMDRLSGVALTMANVELHRRGVTSRSHRPRAVPTSFPVTPSRSPQKRAGSALSSSPSSNATVIQASAKDFQDEIDMTQKEKITQKRDSKRDSDGRGKTSVDSKESGPYRSLIC